MTPERPTADTWLDERGVTLTAAGVEQARRRMDQVRAARTPEERAQAHTRFLARLDEMGADAA